MELRKTLEEIGRIETQIAQRHHFRLSKEASSRMLDLSLLLFVGVIKPFSRPFFNQRAELLDQWSILKSQQHNIQARLTDAQLNLTNMKAQNGLKNITHLSEVHKWLYQIQQSLIQHNVFWKSVQVILEAINDETFAKEHFIGDSELKEIFLTNIDSAQEHWKAFGESCLKALNIYSLQDKDAYKFLDRSSSFLPDTIDEEINILDPRVPLHPRFYNL
ncbi:uncharacterized protein LOC122330446 [Puntigrus tetrazona]|uniref:uncharacterized protein LOC122330446 n=1 Tax=Puntigrus tetrazona TaxID=1606681 RepID=UPI001C8AA591|nr:uncharacterized protein LOC122330446 [Puntigrus tetrazona]